MMIKEPRYELRDRETGKKVLLTTDELQVALWLAERELEKRSPQPVKVGGSPDAHSGHQDGLTVIGIGVHVRG